MHVHQINLQKAVGGGEIYTRWFTRALADAGASISLYVNGSNAFWRSLASDKVRLVAVRDPGEIAAHLPGRDALVVTQCRIPDTLAEAVARNHVLTGFAHMPMLGRSGAEFTRYALVFTVSEYCIRLLQQAGIAQTYPEAMYGTGETFEAADGAEVSVLRARSPYHWDARKGRDRLMAAFEPLVRAFGSPPIFTRRPGLTLGIVSLISPIKQFPALFAQISPRIARVPGVVLEIFGEGGYAQVRDMRRALAPIAGRVRFWGYQRNVRAVYPQLDYLMTGLPEKEALGLNVLEAQALGTPVLAPRAPPFTETVLDGLNGYLYRDPREDQGASFGDLLASLASGRPRPDPLAAAAHPERFSYAAMVARTQRMLHSVARRFPALDGEGTARG